MQAEAHHAGDRDLRETSALVLIWRFGHKRPVVDKTVVRRSSQFNSDNRKDAAGQSTSPNHTTPAAVSSIQPPQMLRSTLPTCQSEAVTLYGLGATERRSKRPPSLYNGVGSLNQMRIPALFCRRAQP